MLRILGVFAFCCLSAASGFSFADEDGPSDSGQPTRKKATAKKSRPEPTHKQARVLAPKQNGEKISLNTFCLAPGGELLMCVGGPSVDYVPKADNPGEYEIKRTKSPAFVQKYTAEGELVAAFPLDFKPTGINMMPGGNEFVVAGEGWLARLTLKGELVKKGRTPQVGDFEKFKTDAINEAKEEIKQHVQGTQDQLEQIEKEIAKLEATSDEKRTNQTKAQLEAKKTTCKQLKDQVSQMEEMFGFGSPEDIVRDRLTVTGVAVTDKDVFVSVRKMKGHGYDVWRTNHDFGEGEKVVSDLGGCCGQLDIQGSAGKLLIAENGKFRVGIYDRDGDMTTSFGKRDRKANDGFGSCCNPMNVRCCDSGDILTAESSIGDIKRFTSNGKFVSYIGRAKIGGGCKHVALEFDPARNRYYMQHQDKGHICVLVPLAEITGPSEDELLEQAARAGLGAKLAGAWTIEKAKKSKKSGIGGLLTTVAGGRSETPGDTLTFQPDGSLKIVGGQLGQFSSSTTELEWKPIQQNDKVLEVAIVMDGVENYHFRVNFESDDSVKIDLRYEENVMATAAYQRKVTEKKAAAEKEAPKDSN